MRGVLLSIACLGSQKKHLNEGGGGFILVLHVWVLKRGISMRGGGYF